MDVTWEPAPTLCSLLRAPPPLLLWLCLAACWTLGPWPVPNPCPPAVEAQSLNHWPPGKSPPTHLFWLKFVRVPSCPRLGQEGWAPRTWIWIIPLPLTGCVTSGK